MNTSGRMSTIAPAISDLNAAPVRVLGTAPGAVGAVAGSSATARSAIGSSAVRRDACGLDRSSDSYLELGGALLRLDSRLDSTDGVFIDVGFLLAGTLLGLDQRGAAQTPRRQYGATAISSPGLPKRGSRTARERPILRTTG